MVDFCEDMQFIPGQPLESLARWYRYVYGDAECFDPSYATAIERYSNPAWDEWGTSTGSQYIAVTFIRKVELTFHFQDVSGTSCNAHKLDHFC